MLLCILSVYQMQVYLKAVFLELELLDSECMCSFQKW